MLWDEEPMEITQTDRKVGNRVFLQTFSFLFIPSFVKVKTGTEVSSQCPDFACSSLKCCSHRQLSCTCQHGWHQLLVYTGSLRWAVLAGHTLVQHRGKGSACTLSSQAFWTGKLKWKTGPVDEELPICAARPRVVKHRLNTTQKRILGELATPGLKHWSHT